MHVCKCTPWVHHVIRARKRALEPLKPALRMAMRAEPLRVSAEKPNWVLCEKTKHLLLSPGFQNFKVSLPGATVFSYLVSLS